jgi:hypothetical protein
MVANGVQQNIAVDTSTEEATVPTYPPIVEVGEMSSTEKDKTDISTTTMFVSSTTESTTDEEMIGTASSDTGEILDKETTTQTTSLLDKETTTPPTDYVYDYDGQLTLDDLDKIGPGACLFDGKVYVSAQQIPRENPCDFCFCFRGDIICLQQSCPPPIPGCREEVIEGFCCPRYECPVKIGTFNVTVPVPTTPQSLADWIFGGASSNEDSPDTYTQQISGCEVQGNFYERGAIVEASSSACLQCR